MPLINASREAILKANFKDKHHQRVLTQRVNRIYRNILGDRSWILWEKEVSIVGDFIYYLLTTINRSQTLGEEYASMIQVGSNKKKIPSTMQRWMLTMLQTVCPYFVKKALDGKDFFKGLSNVEKKQFGLVLNLLQNFLPCILKFHTLLFYMEGVYTSLPKRVVGIKHVLIRPLAQHETDLTVFRVLGLVLGVQLFTDIYLLIRNAYTTMNSLEAQQNIDNPLDVFPYREAKEKSNSMRCALCLEFIRDISVTPCGHLFCWGCIMTCCTVKNECPSCREQCKPATVVYLQHFTVG